MHVWYTSRYDTSNDFIVDSKNTSSVHAVPPTVCRYIFQKINPFVFEIGKHELQFVHEYHAL